MSPVKIGVLISGSGTNLQALINSINKGEIRGEILVVISNKRDAYGLKRAGENNIENIYLDIKDFKDEAEYNLELVKILKARGVDLVVLAGYLRVLSGDFIKAYKNKIINIHPSLIPSFCGRGYYGKKVHKAVLDYGAKITGATVHFVDEGTDTGPIIMQDIVRVDLEDDVDSLQKKVLEKEHQLLIKAVGKFCDGRIEVRGRTVIVN